MADNLGQIATRLVQPDVRQDSDSSTVADLRQSAIRGNLTERAVNSAFDKGLLSTSDYQGFLQDSYTAVAGEDNKEDKKFDKFWLDEVKRAYGSSYQQKEGEEFVLLAWEKLQSEGITGAKRQELVRKWLSEETGKQSEKAALYKGLPAEKKQAMAKWGWDMGSKVVSSLEKSGNDLTGLKLAAESDRLAAYVKNYAFLGAQEALDYRLQNNLPVSIELLQRDIAKRSF